MQAAPSQPIVLVIFHCQSGETEKLALSAAVGAVQGRALIRLRRLPDVGMVTDNDDLIRMRKEYVPPAEKDLLGADAIILAAPLDHPYIEMMRRLADQKAFANKAAGHLDLNPSFFSELGFKTIVNPSGDALTLGRAVADAARALKQE